MHVFVVFFVNPSRTACERYASFSRPRNTFISAVYTVVSFRTYLKHSVDMSFAKGPARCAPSPPPFSPNQLVNDISFALGHFIPRSG